MHGIPASLSSPHTLHSQLRLDDALDVGAVHGSTGALGALLIGVFASTGANPNGADGLVAGGSAALLGKQAVGVAVAGAYSAGVTAALCVALRRCGGLRVDEADEDTGLDIAEHDEPAYEWLHALRARAPAAAAAYTPRASV